MELFGSLHFAAKRISEPPLPLSLTARGEALRVLGVCVSFQWKVSHFENPRLYVLPVKLCIERSLDSVCVCVCVCVRLGWWKRLQPSGIVIHGDIKMQSAATLVHSRVRSQERCNSPAIGHMIGCRKSLLEKIHSSVVHLSKFNSICKKVTEC